MAYLRIRNWEKFQHYKERNPPWIKLHRELLRDYQFECLQDASKLHLILIWLLASQLENKIPNDEQWIRKQIGVKSRIDLKSLLDAGFLECEHVASTLLADCKQVAIPETEAETETEAEADVNSPSSSLENIWNANCGDLPKIKVLSSDRKRAWATRWKESPEISYWVEIVKSMASNPFFSGDNDRGWRATVDFILKPGKHVRISEGQYQKFERKKDDEQQFLSSTPIRRAPKNAEGSA